MAKRSKISIVRQQLEEDGLNKQQTDFLVKFYEMIRRRSDPTNHNIFCNEIGDPLGLSVDNVRELVEYFRKRPHRYTATNGRSDFASFTATDYFMRWLHNIGVK
jgi:hypothetical protein